MNNKALTLLVGLFVIGTASATFNYPNTAKLIANLSFDETSGANAQSITGYANGLYNYTVTAAGQNNMAWYSNGINTIGKVNVSRKNTLAPMNLNKVNFSMCAWVNLTNNDTIGCPNISIGGCYLWHPRPEMDARVHVYNATLVFYTFSGGADFQLLPYGEKNKKHFICVSYNGTHKVEFDDNRTNVEAYTLTPGAGVSSSNSIADSFNTTATSLIWNGTIDEFAVFNRSMPLTEMVQLYQNSCNYKSGVWGINISDNCNVSTSNNLQRNNITIYGSENAASGWIISTGSIFNYSNVSWVGTNTRIWGSFG